MDIGHIKEFCKARDIVPVEVRGINAGQGTFFDDAGRAFFEVETNFWASEPPETNEVVYLHCNLHHGGIVLRPTYVKIDGAWYNTLTGLPAPAGLPYRARGSNFQKAISGKDDVAGSINAGWRHEQAARI